MITTTLNRIRAHEPCSKGCEKLLKGLGKTQADDEPEHSLGAEAEADRAVTRIRAYGTDMEI